MPKRIVAVAITAVAGSGVDGAGAPGVLVWVGARAIHISTVRIAVGCTFEAGVTGTGLFAAFGAASD